MPHRKSDTKRIGTCRGRSLYNALTLATGRDDLILEDYKTLWNNEKWSAKSRKQLKEAYYQELDRL